MYPVSVYSLDVVNFVCYSLQRIIPKFFVMCQSSSIFLPTSHIMKLCTQFDSKLLRNQQSTIKFGSLTTFSILLIFLDVFMMVAINIRTNPVPNLVSQLNLENDKIIFSELLVMFTAIINYFSYTVDFASIRKVFEKHIKGSDPRFNASIIILIKDDCLFPEERRYASQID